MLTLRFSLVATILLSATMFLSAVSTSSAAGGGGSAGGADAQRGILKERAPASDPRLPPERSGDVKAGAAPSEAKPAGDAR